MPRNSHVLGLLGTSPLMRELGRQVEGTALTDLPVLLVGEAGVGKSHIARAMHEISPRALHPYHALECTGRTSHEVRTELTEYADSRGTLYLEEVGDLCGSLQEEVLERVGAGMSSASESVRFIAASTKDLATEVTELRFSEQLYYRLGVMPLHIPPLRARSPEDIRATANGMIRELRRGLPDAPRSIGEATLDAMSRYAWPGNIRELRNVLEGSLLRARGGETVDVMHLPAEVLDASADVAQLHVSRTLAEVERAHILRTLRAHGANRTRAARDLGISRATLIKKIREYGLAERQAALSGGSRGSE